MIRKTAVAGAFYPAERNSLTSMIKGFLADAPDKKIKNIRGIIAPHAGYIYSGPTAGFAYRQLQNLPDIKYNVFLLGPSHYVYTTASVGDFEFFETPLGRVKVNQILCEKLLKAADLEFFPQAHGQEHSLEVQLPFLQMTINDFEIIPIVIGEASPDRLCEILSPYFLKKENLFVFSSDLSHYNPYELAKSIDKRSIEIITSLDIVNDDQIDACGKTGVQTAMRLARKNGCKIETLDYRNSGDTAGEKGGVVGYSAMAISSSNL